MTHEQGNTQTKPHPFCFSCGMPSHIGTDCNLSSSETISRLLSQVRQKDEALSECVRLLRDRTEPTTLSAAGEVNWAIKKAEAALSPDAATTGITPDRGFAGIPEHLHPAPPLPADDVIEWAAQKLADNRRTRRGLDLLSIGDMPADDRRMYMRDAADCISAANLLRQSVPVDRDSVYREANQEVLRGLLPFIPEKDAQKAPDKTGVDHLRTMIYTVLTEKMPSDKVARWTGFIQGVLCARDYISVEEERDRTRPIFAEAAELASASPPADVAGMRSALLAFADCAEKLSEEHNIVQPFLNIYKEHGAAIAVARALPIPASPTDVAVKALVEAKELEGFINGLMVAGNMKSRFHVSDDTGRVINDLRRQIDEKIEATRATLVQHGVK